MLLYVRINLNYNISNRSIAQQKYGICSSSTSEYWICWMSQLWLNMTVKHFGCTTIHNKALYKCIIHSFIHDECHYAVRQTLLVSKPRECLKLFTCELGVLGFIPLLDNHHLLLHQLVIHVHTRLRSILCFEVVHLSLHTVYACTHCVKLTPQRLLALVQAL